MAIIDALTWRYAVRQFANQRLEDRQIEALLTATRLSASAYGLQPYHLLLLESADIRQQLLPHSMGQDKVVASSHLLVFAAHTHIGDQTVDRYLDKLATVRQVPLAELAPYADHMKTALAAMSAAEQQEWAHQQAYIALGTLLTSAAALGIDTCPMTGFDRAGYDAVLDLPAQGLTSTAICALGVRHPDDQTARLPKVRFDDHEMVTRR